jgi:hypothetical protein
MVQFMGKHLEFLAITLFKGGTLGSCSVVGGVGEPVDGGFGLDFIEFVDILSVYRTKEEDSFPIFVPEFIKNMDAFNDLFYRNGEHCCFNKIDDLF